jgi:glycosyltransferase involved in cell wall biosynthesis
VTINGKWPKQKSHLISSENPCLEEADLANGLLHQKNFNSPAYTICYIGALNDDKGIPEIVECLNNPKVRHFIKHFYIVGDGPKREAYQKQIHDLTDVHFLGFKDKKGVHETLQQSHFILLPSKSEGFPKVIAEATCYGCIPIVSDVSCIGQYINHSNGYLWNTREPFYGLVLAALSQDKKILLAQSEALKKIAPLFSYTRFETNILTLLRLPTKPKPIIND